MINEYDKLAVTINSQIISYKFNDVVSFGVNNYMGDLIILSKGCMNQHFFSHGKKIYLSYVEDKKRHFKCMYVDNGYVSISHNIIQFNTLKISEYSIYYKAQTALESEEWNRFQHEAMVRESKDTWIDIRHQEFTNFNY